MSPTGPASSSNHRTAGQVDLSDKQVQEVSCGHGGGASYLVRTLHPASYTGLDFNADGIAFCQKRHQLPGLDFVHGDAESLPFGDESFDAVIIVEASHAYPRLPRLLAEVARVLRPGGHFLYAVFRGSDEFAVWQAALSDAPMRLSSRRDINPEVLRGMERDARAGIAEPSNVTAANTPGAKRSMAGANAEAPHVTNRGPIWSNAPTRRPVHDDGTVKRMLDSVTTGLKPRSTEPGEPDSAASDDDNSSHQPSSES
jgi:SAM-dependent methyltransferase